MARIAAIIVLQQTSRLLSACPPALSEAQQRAPAAFFALINPYFTQQKL
ncbi:hypothetical protein [Microcoleus sp. FACHB-68]|nr:hypothetical protein [Microcoleus sp. FACHB-68]MBD1936428.1 hypothetical protein [Microcoleus sp. FACHB-68]